MTGLRFAARLPAVASIPRLKAWRSRGVNKLAEEVLGWYYDLTDRRPAESEMRKAVKQVLAALRKV